MPAKDNSPREPREPRDNREREIKEQPLETAGAPEGDKPVYRYPGSGQAAKQQKLFKLEDIVKWDMNFGVVMGPVGYDPRFKCPYCESRMLLATHEGGTTVKGIRITYHCPDCGATGMTQFAPPGKKLTIPDEDFGEVTVVMKEPVISVKEQPARNESRERPARPPRNENREREDNRERAERPARTERPERQERPERAERQERTERPERQERQERGSQNERNEGPRRERRERPTGERREAQERREPQGEKREERRNTPRQENAAGEGKEAGGNQQPRQRRYPRPRPPRPEAKQEG